MKIIRIANKFEDEGKDTLENIEDRIQFEGKQEILDLHEKEPSHTAQIMYDIAPSFESQLEVNYTHEGAEGWFEYKDGKTYHIIIKPAHPLHDVIDSSELDPSDNLF
jgi:phage gpG-like protein